MATPNKARGEVAVIIDGAQHIMVLTLGAMAKIESVTGAAHLNEVGQMLAKPKSEHLIGVMASLLEAGGTPDAEALVRSQSLNVLNDLSTGMMEAFSAAGMTGEGGERPLENQSPPPGANGSQPDSLHPSAGDLASLPASSGA